MKKITILSIVAAAVLFTGCGEKSKESATKAVESTKEAVSHITDAAKEAADNAVVESKEAVEATKEVASQAMDDAKENVAEATAAVAETVQNVAGAAAYSKCSGCHGADGKTLALGKSPAIAGKTKEELVSMLNEYKAGIRNVSGMGALMKGQVASMDDAAIEAVSAYISTLK